MAQAVSKLKKANLFFTLPKFAEHGVAIMDTLRNTCSRTKHLYMDSVDLSTMEADLFGKEVCSKLVTLNLTNVELSTQQATELFIGIKEEFYILGQITFTFLSKINKNRLPMGKNKATTLFYVNFFAF